mgnify:FL=1
MVGSVNDWLDMMPHTVTHEEFSARSSYGAPAYGSPASYRARVSYESSYVRKSDGSEVLARGKVVIAGTPTVTPEDRITLPDGSTPQIITANVHADGGGAHHVSVFFG